MQITKIYSDISKDVQFLLSSGDTTNSGSTEYFFKHPQKRNSTPILELLICRNLYMYVYISSNKIMLSRTQTYYRMEWTLAKKIIDLLWSIILNDMMEVFQSNSCKSNTCTHAITWCTIFNNFYKNLDSTLNSSLWSPLFMSCLPVYLDIYF